MAPETLPSSNRTEGIGGIRRQVQVIDQGLIRLIRSIRVHLLTTCSRALAVQRRCPTGARCRTEVCRVFLNKVF